MSHEGIRIASKDEQAQQEAQSHPLPKIAVTPEKVRVLMTEGKGLEIDWADGHKSVWGFTWLRDACPCATCVDERTQQGRKPGQPRPKPAALLPMYAPPPKPASARIRWGATPIQFIWADGHSGGIYSWDYLRRVCQCQECTFSRDETTGTPN